MMQQIIVGILIHVCYMTVNFYLKTKIFAKLVFF